MSEHRLSVKRSDERVQVVLNGEVIADSTRTVRLEESKHSPVYYFPREDVKMECLERSTHETYCPFKGTAAYYSFKGGAKNAVWTYEKPLDPMLAIREHLAFYRDKVDSIQVKGKP